MKYIFAFALLLATSTGIASAHGLHVEMLEAASHVRIHLLENGISLVVSASIILVGYGLYRKRQLALQSQDGKE